MVYREYRKDCNETLNLRIVELKKRRGTYTFIHFVK